ncbi:hypothetical protein [Pelagibaculum spongiae]|uniref:Uncharacterized protein n=1 Tax=Pelagibaculum spongiae TaxID=2080658 RepID=A0A2V1GSF1_9GAMM|nr:hypothetical protein [Pelagibaculum spongiae]PVZ66286.1 hypothetical protein DC094_16410 [Pelagibaculum spongiae]
MMAPYRSSQLPSFQALWALQKSAVEDHYQGGKIDSSDADGSHHPESLLINCQGKAPTRVVELQDVTFEQ